MPTSTYSLISLSRTSDLSISTSDPYDTVTTDFLMLFVNDGDVDEENRKISIQSLQQNTKEIREKFDDFIDKYQAKDKKIFQFRSYFQSLEEDEYFMLWPTENLDNEKRTQLHQYLTSLKEGIDFNEIVEQHNILFKELLQHYNMLGFDKHTKKAVGEPDKSKRVCRFCGRKQPNVTFKNVAHAISESLGNKKIILYEECDECNARFGSASGIEINLITYLRLYGNFFGVRGKNGIHKIKGKNFELTNDGTIKLDHYLQEGEEPSADDAENLEFLLETFEEISDQDIYRTLCKYALSVIGDELLPEFTETIKWINRETTLSKLPKVGILKSYELFNYHPSILLYHRKTVDTNLPFLVGEFHHTLLTFVFIIPLAKTDEKDFVNEEEHAFFWDFFKHYNSAKGWQYKDLSNNEKKAFKINLHFDQRKS